MRDFWSCDWLMIKGSLPWGAGLLWLLLASPELALAEPYDTVASAEPAVAAALDTSHASDQANWVVLEVRGSATWRLQDTAGWQAFKQGQVLQPGSVIETGANGRVMLVTGGDELLVGSSSRLIVPISREPASLRHERGRVLVHVEPRRNRAIQVRTPLLSMGIKGTSFELVVEQDRDRVLVLEGEVQVTTPGSDEVVDLEAGEGLAAQPGSRPTPFQLPVPDAARHGALEHPSWLLSDTPSTDSPNRTEQSDHPVQGSQGLADRASEFAPTQPATRNQEGRTEGNQDARQPTRSDYGLGSEAFRVALLGLAAGALVLLLSPGLALVQAFREHWQNRPSGKGRRRRSLTRDP
jgi:uncharacterized protein YaiE (UPF0345 family)